jgi:hypothetical protein
MAGSGHDEKENPLQVAVLSGRRLGPLLLDRIPDHRRDIRAAEPRDGAEAGRRRDVDLGEIAVDGDNQ